MRSFDFTPIWQPLENGRCEAVSYIYKPKSIQNTQNNINLRDTVI